MAIMPLLVLDGIRCARPVPKYHDGSLKRLAPTDKVRRAVALRSGAIPGETAPIQCAYCGVQGTAHWPRLRNGKPGSWVALGNLSLDHIYPYSLGGSNRDPGNFVIACKRCNSSKGSRLLSEWMEARA